MPQGFSEIKMVPAYISIIQEFVVVECRFVWFCFSIKAISWKREICHSLTTSSLFWHMSCLFHVAKILYEE